eukprot:1969169-Amphidinium_carterae.1
MATFTSHAQQAMQRYEMATEHCIAAFVDFYQVRVLVMHKEHQAAWIYIPAGETMAGPSMLVWLHQQHFQSGPTFDLSQINHAISSNADEEAFKSFCLRGGHEPGPWTVRATKHVQDFVHRWAQQLSLVPVQNVEPTCMLAGDSMAIEWMMLITSDLCRQVMKYPTMTVCDICVHTLGDTALDKHSDARSWREVNGHIMPLPTLAFRKIKSHQQNPPPESFAALCWAGNAKADKMVPRQLQQRPPLSHALEQEHTPWKRFLVLNALIAAVRYTDTTDTDAPKQLAWEHDPRQPTSDKGPWPK